jgi:hypothetical protein
MRKPPKARKLEHEDVRPTGNEEPNIRGGKTDSGKGTPPDERHPDDKADEIYGGTKIPKRSRK